MIMSSAISNMADDTDTAPNNISNAYYIAPMQPMPSKNKSQGRTKKKTRLHSQADVAAAAEEHVALADDQQRSAQTTTEEPDKGKDQKQNGSCNDNGNLAASMLDEKVEMIEVKTEDGSTRRVPKLRKGLSVSYKSADGVMDALILDVHLDDLLEPYYTIKFPDGREKQTDNAHIELPSRAEKTNKMDTDNAVAVETTDKDKDLRAAMALKNFQYQPIRGHNDKKIDTKPSTKQSYANREPSKSLKRQLSRRSNTSSIDPPGMDISARTDELDHSKNIQEFLNSKVVPFGEDEIDSLAVGAIAITNNDDIPEVINVPPRPDVRFRRSATSGSNLSSLDILESAYTEEDDEMVLTELQNALFELSKIGANLDPTARDVKASHPYVSNSRSTTLNTKLPSTTTKHVSRHKTDPIRSRAFSIDEEKKKRLDQERLFLERLKKEKRRSRQKLAREKAATEKEDRSKISRGSSRGSELLSDVDSSSSKDVSGMRRIKSMSKLTEILSRKK